MKGRAQYYAACAALIEEGSFDYESADLPERYILMRDDFSKTKTDSFLDWCWEKNKDIDDILDGVINEGNLIDYGTNKRHPESKVLVLLYRNSAVSDESIYCKMSIEESRKLLHIDIHRSFSDDESF